ncbi:MAG: transcriptional regulator [Alteromonas sp. Nap_26]|nr:MAG: transcriptional regulator [Alteromonas sp. Nap_26]
MDRFDMMQRFVQTARLGSFSRAADVLGLPKSSVSQAITQLESQLGTRLLHRSTRQVRLTSDGEAFLPQCQAILNEWEAMSQQFVATSSLITGELRIDMPSRFATLFLLPHISKFMDLYPNINLKISSVDHPVDLAKEGVDCVIRVGELRDSSLVAVPLFSYPIYNCLSKTYIDRYGKPKSLDDLKHHKLIDYSHSLSQKTAEFEYVHAGKTCTLTMPSAISVNNTEAYFSACLNGLGLAQLPILANTKLFKNDELVSVLPDFQAPAMPVNLLYLSRRHMPQRLDVFIKWMKGVIEEQTS